VLSAALGADTRIGSKYLKGGVAYGGPCFPRDNKAFAALARSLGVPCAIAEATDQINDYQVERLAGAVAATAPSGARVAILGLAYKPDTSVFEKSQGFALARALRDDGYRVMLADPLAATSAAAALGGADVASDFESALRAADVAVVTTPLPGIRDVDVRAVHRPGAPLTIIDPWGLLKGTALGNAVTLILLGRRSAAALEGVPVVVQAAIPH
jgi:UDPglucose 6-dehydrogenase